MKDRKRPKDMRAEIDGVTAFELDGFVILKLPRGAVDGLRWFKKGQWITVVLDDEK